MVVNVKMYVIMGRLLHLQELETFKPEPEALIKSTQRNLKLKEWSRGTNIEYTRHLKNSGVSPTNF